MDRYAMIALGGALGAASAAWGSLRFVNSTAAEDRVAYIAEYELWLEAGRRPDLREAAQSWCDAEQRSSSTG